MTANINLTATQGSSALAASIDKVSPGSVTQICLEPVERLKLQQLLQCSFWEEKTQPLESSNAVAGGDNEGVNLLPDKWELTRGISLHDWQRECVEAWFQNGNRGVIKVVTGSGKTILALGIAERLQRTDAPNLFVAIVVPTIVLLSQWREVLTSQGNLPPQAIGQMGGGHNDGFQGPIRVLICVLNSASKKLPPEIARAGISKDLLLVVDECHRAGAAEMQQVFRTERAYSLGLSATPERDDEPPEDEAEVNSDDEEREPQPFEETVLGQELGGIVFEMNYAEAISRGVLPPFRIVHYGLSLQADERNRYESISREIKDLRAELETGKRRGLALIRWCRSKAAASNRKAARFISLASERKQLLYQMSERSLAVSEILRAAFAQNAETKAILFHESISAVMSLFNTLRLSGYPVVAEHSAFPDSLRAESLRLFRNGIAQTIVSARSLIEGFNVPSADLGIIVAASSSVRQRVQTLGRLLRRSRHRDGSEKQAILYVLYASNTVDELIYEKADWEHFVGADRNEYMLWPDVSKDEPVLASGPPRTPPIDESIVDPLSLRVGETYPGDPLQGRLFSLDTQGTVRDENGNLLKPHSQLQEFLSNHGKGGGRFRVTPLNRYVIKMEKDEVGWRSVFLGKLEIPPELVTSESAADAVLIDLKPGDEYPLGRVLGKAYSVLQRDRRLIAEKSRSGIRFIVPLEQIKDSAKKAAVSSIQSELARVYASGRYISKITVTQEGHVVYVFNNHAFFVGQAPNGADGFPMEAEGS